MLTLLVTWPDWSIPWAGIGALCAGAGSLLSGLAAYRMATRKDPGEEPKARRDDRE